jgi:hypothetical protein
VLKARGPVRAADCICQLLVAATTTDVAATSIGRGVGRLAVQAGELRGIELVKTRLPLPSHALLSRRYWPRTYRNMSSVAWRLYLRRRQATRCECLHCRDDTPAPGAVTCAKGSACLAANAGNSSTACSGVPGASKHMK